MMSQGTNQLASLREIKGALRDLKASLPKVQADTKAGCGVSLFVRDYTLRALKTNHVDNHVLNNCHHVWQTQKGYSESERLAEFSIISRSGLYEGEFFKVKRIVLDDLSWTRFRALGLTQEFNKVVQERLRYRTPQSAVTLIALGDTLKTLMGMGKRLVSFKVDNGLHLVFREKARGPKHLCIYLGGWFDETLFPLDQYESSRISNALRKQE